MTISTARARRRTRREQAEENQKRLLSAALEVFTELGFHAATVEEIAATAGFTTGAVFSRFTSKADLFLGLLEQTVEQRTAEILGLDGTEAGDFGPTFTRSWWARVRERPAWMLAVMEFRIHAARDPELNARYAALHERHVRVLSEALKRDLERAHAEPHEPLVDVARMALAMGSGLVLERWTIGDEAIGDLPERSARLVMRGLVAAPVGDVPKRRGKRDKS